MTLTTGKPEIFVGAFIFIGTDEYILNIFVGFITDECNRRIWAVPGFGEMALVFIG
jgi:hypothetical protein